MAVEEDEPRPKKKRKTDDDDDPPARKKEKKAGGPSMMVILLAGGGLALLGCCVCGGGSIGIYYAVSSPSIVGAWQPDGGGAVKIEFSFEKDGTGSHLIVLNNPKGGLPLQTRTNFNYTFTAGNPGVLEITPTNIEVGGIAIPAKGNSARTSKIDVRFEGKNAMRLTNQVQAPGPFATVALLWRRVR